MPEQPLISVRGEAVVKVEPEIARLEVSVISRDADRATALHMLEERVERVSKILASFPDVIDAIDNTGVRASDYAEGLGCELTGLVELADARLMSDGGTGEQGARFTAKLPQRTRVVAPEEFSFDLAPAQQTVRATIETRFRISQPDLAKL